MTRIVTSGRLTDDLSHKNQVYKDIKFLEGKFKGVEPLEIVIDAGKPRQIQKLSTLKKIDKLQTALMEFDHVSRSISVADLAKYAKQAFYNNDPGFYQMPNNQERNFIFSYIPKDEKSGNLLKAFVDSTQQFARITLQVADLGTEEMQLLQDSIRAAVKEVLGDDSGLTASVTGASVVFLKGTHYLINNLAQSLSLAIALIALIMAFLFRSWRMVIISMLPNIIPLLFTAGMMGWIGIPIKPSTILVFSIAFGISVDDTIHFLAKYRQELKASNWNIGKSVNNAIRETGVSMFYTSVILFFGFSIFMGSGFGGTVALGMLVAMTLLVAIITNLVLLPSMLLSLEKLLTNEEFAEPPLELIEDEEDTQIK
jgi:predicted RND superfamily exporter protein